MSVSTTQSLFQYSIASLGQPFSPACAIQNTSDFVVTYTSKAGVDTVLTLATDYTVTGSSSAGVIASPTVTLEGTGLHYAVGGALTIQRKPPLTQPTNFVDGVKYLASSQNNAYDWLCYAAQELYDIATRSLRLPATSAALSEMALNSRKGMILAFDALGNLIFLPSTSNLTDISQSLVLPTGATVQTTLGNYLARKFWVNDYGAKVDGVTNDTAAIARAYAAAKAAGGGSIIFPPGNCLGNLTIKDRGIALEGQNGSAPYNVSTLFAWDDTIPTVTVGDDSAYTNGSRISNMGICGDKIAQLVAGTAALKYGGGAWDCVASNVELLGGTKTLWFEGGPTYGSSNVTVCDSSRIRNNWTASGTRAVYLKRTAPGYSTACRIVNSGVSSHAEYAIEMNTETFYLTNVYVDCDALKGLYFPGSGFLRCTGLTIDPGTTGVVVITITDTTYDPARYIDGDINIASQKIRFTGPTDITCPSATTYFTRNHHLMRPTISDSFTLTALADPFAASTPATFDLDASGRVRLSNVGLNLLAIASATTYANNAAAVTGGLTAGMLYRNGDALQIVH
jgi:Pectate lyase superfamily protein